MCGRFTLTSQPAEVAEHFGLGALPELQPRYNVAPGQEVATITAAADTRILTPRRWGLVPFFAKDPSHGLRMINARVETVAEKPAYREAFRARRCLVPADGFYEWAGEAGARRPHHIHRPDRSPFGFAGLWERWQAPDGTTLETCALLTTEADATLRRLHHRMPVILDPPVWGAWLDPELSDPARLFELVGTGSDAPLAYEVVDYRVNDARYDGPECLAPGAPELAQGRLL